MPATEASREVRTVRLDDPLVTPLLDGLAEEYTRRYGAAHDLTNQHAEQFDPPGGLFIVVLEGDLTIAGGGYRRIADDRCEAKRMWTRPSHRRLGLALMVLRALEDEARAVGYQTLVLETGPRQPEAAAMYERAGYERIPVYGSYPLAIAFELALTRS